jgi:predicted cupin superfamily sugar epimerase
VTAGALTAPEIIALLGLARHPEGGWYRETFRDVVAPQSRAASTAIYFLLEAGEVSQWHRVDAAEAWHWYAGAPLALSISDDGRTAREVILGADLRAGERPQAVVPAGAWQQARSLGAFTLVGCTVAPGFRFEGFELAPDDFRPAAR